MAIDIASVIFIVVLVAIIIYIRTYPYKIIKKIKEKHPKEYEAYKKKVRFINLNYMWSLKPFNLQPDSEVESMFENFKKMRIISYLLVAAYFIYYFAMRDFSTLSTGQYRVFLAVLIGVAIAIIYIKFRKK